MGSLAVDERVKVSDGDETIMSYMEIALRSIHEVDVDFSMNLLCWYSTTHTLPVSKQAVD